ncbi:TniQ family protein [Thalassorhabdomicrobium marinisediminis]|uniref:TniQ domain-containing protein n=1 Tax=Thalassorhabdomicrobium marinisediminis TaxID=2170577 RepID=A0A2T7FT01_9RHOB|nr:TniQ family protein [Thalassorhabdomicrobium marinisediminis]PVA05273.1 hypothetical protein DC363_15745 [Thalassorhabdomicrobium marinisediminis]
MALLPTLPLIPGESLTSYVNRVAKFHCNLSLTKFLRFFEISQQELLRPEPETLRRISDLTGQPAEDLANMSFLRAGTRLLTIMGETVHSEFTDLSTRPLCPECLLEDLGADSTSGGMPVGRLEWQMQPVRVCGKHGVVLQARNASTYVDRFRLLPELSAERAMLDEMMSKAQFHKPSRLQTYAIDRLNGCVGPAWLDEQRLDYAARACEMLGVILVAGTHIDLRAVTDAQWSAAGDLGFSYAMDGAEGIYAGLQVAFDQFVSKNAKGGPQKAFGRFYQWLQFNKNKKPAGPIRDVARDFILDHFSIEPGTNLMGDIVNERRVHSASSLARESGDHPKTINRAIILAGLADGDTEKVTATMTFDAKAAEELMDRIRTSISVRGLEGYLNCNRVQAQQLVRTGILPRLLPDGPRVVGSLKNVSRESADEFLEALMGEAKVVSTASEGALDIVAAAEKSRWPAIDIVRGILSGLFETVEVVSPSLKFKGILVDPREVRATLERNQLQGYIGVKEAVELLGMRQPNLNTLLRIRKADGSRYITERIVTNAKDVPVRLFPVEEIEQFLRDYVSLKEIADREKLSSKVMRAKIDGWGVAPITEGFELGRIWYRRVDLETADLENA